MNTNNKFEKELLQFFSKYNYITKDEDGDIMLWYEKPNPDGRGYWHSNSTEYYLDRFKFSEFENKDWNECIVTLNPNMEQIDELERNKKQIEQYLSNIQEKINCVEKINNEVDLKEYMESLMNSQFVNETYIKEIDTKLLHLKTL